MNRKEGGLMQNNMFKRRLDENGFLFLHKNNTIEYYFKLTNLIIEVFNQEGNS